MKNEKSIQGAPYTAPETETIVVSIEANIMSNKNGSIPGLTDDDTPISF